MIRDREPFPIWHERVFGTAQHRADVVRVVIGGIKIRVIANARRQKHRHIFLRMENAIAQGRVIAQGRGFGGEQMLNHFPSLAPGGPPEREKGVQRTLRENTPTLKFRPLEVAQFFEHRQVEDELADRNANPRFALGRLEYSKGKILDRKMRIG